MSLTLNIKKLGCLGNESISLEEIVQNCGLKYGVYNDFYILEEDQTKNGSCIFYNPERIGRGIYFENSGSEVEISHHIPTTVEEIADFLRLLSEIRRQFVDYEISDDEGEIIPVESLEEFIAGLLEFNFDELIKSANRGKEHRSWILTLAKWYSRDDDSS